LNLKCDVLVSKLQRVSLHPGQYYRDPLEDDPGMLREGPAFTMGGRLRHGGAVSGPKDAADMPGPGEYDVSGPSSSGHAYTIAARAAAASARSLAAAANAPGPGQYDVAAAAAAPSYTMAGRPTADPELRAAVGLCRLNQVDP
jgi:hypothetical protein